MLVLDFTEADGDWMSTIRQVMEITKISKTGGPLTKRITLGPNGSLNSDGSACIMSEGQACRFRFGDLVTFSKFIDGLASCEAIALGALRADLQDLVRITTKDRLKDLQGSVPPDLIVRTGDHIIYRPGQPALALIDIDTKGMPASVKHKIDAISGFLPALASLLPELELAGRAVRRSTSTGIFRTDTRVGLRGSDGLHVFVLVNDGADVERFLRTLHDRCWLHGFGWLMVGAGGQFLDRSLVDRMVYAPERLVFEAAPVLDPPLAQDQASRRPIVIEGMMLDTVTACPSLTIVEQAKLRELRVKEEHRLAPDAARARSAFIVQHSKRLAERTGISPEIAAQVIARQCCGILLPSIVLQFDDPKLAGATVADVLADPARFESATLADPLEGVEYGACKAKVMRRANGSTFIHSFAHGRTVYELKLDACAIETALNRTPANEVASTFVRLAVAAELDADELEHLRDLTSQGAGVGKRAIEQKLKAARQERASQRAQEERDRRAAERCDPRPQIAAPAPDAPWLPQMAVLNEVLGNSRAPEPPARDIDGVIAQVRVRRVPNMHALTQEGSNEKDTDETRIPPPEQPLLTRLDETQLAELIERHIEYIDKTGDPVHLASPFVKHFHTRTDEALPIVAAIATLPIVLADGAILAPRGLDRDRGIVFRIPPELQSVLPTREQCNADVVFEALRFLLDDWLCDVAADFTGKCILIAAALTLIERSLLPDRPVFFVTAGRRGGGKTTTLIMLLMAVTGVRPAAAAWSTNEEERRKALLAYLMEALPSLIWDNIPRGTQISCPHIERSCTTAFYSDRRLGVSEMVAVAASVIHFFTGNNIAPRGDLASRSLQVRLEVDRADPENRSFRHTDPIGWTEANRGRILSALYTILLGNPNLRPGSGAAPQTRFKIWWRLVGSAVEFAANHYTNRVASLMVNVDPACSSVAISFRDLFLSQEEDDEESASLADALAALATTSWPQQKGASTKASLFQASDLARLLNELSAYQIDTERERIATLREFLFPNYVAKPNGHGQGGRKEVEASRWRAGQARRPNVHTEGMARPKRRAEGRIVLLCPILLTMFDDAPRLTWFPWCAWFLSPLLKPECGVSALKSILACVKLSEKPCKPCKPCRAVTAQISLPAVARESRAAGLHDGKQKEEIFWISPTFDTRIAATE